MHLNPFGDLICQYLTLQRQTDRQWTVMAAWAALLICLLRWPFLLRLGHTFWENNHTHQKRFFFFYALLDVDFSPPLFTRFLSFGNWFASKEKTCYIRNTTFPSKRIYFLRFLKLCMGPDSCGCVHKYTGTCVHVYSEVRGQCSMSSSILSTLFWGTGSLPENLELDLARLTSFQSPGSSCLLFPRAGDPNSGSHDV